MSTSQEWPTTTPVEVQVAGDDTPGIAEYAENRLRDMFSDTRFPILHARIRITRLGNPARERPVVAQANLDVDGRIIRAQLRAPTAEEAVDRVRDRLRRRLHDSFGRSVDLGREPTEEPESHQVDEATILPPEEREILRNKVVLSTQRDLVEAAAFMEDMGYDFQLFTDPTTGQDSVLYRSGPGGYRLAQIAPKPDALTTRQNLSVTPLRPDHTRGADPGRGDPTRGEVVLNPRPSRSAARVPCAHAAAAAPRRPPGLPFAT